MSMKQARMLYDSLARAETATKQCAQVAEAFQKQFEDEAMLITKAKDMSRRTVLQQSDGARLTSSSDIQL